LNGDAAPFDFAGGIGRPLFSCHHRQPV